MFVHESQGLRSLHRASQVIEAPKRTPNMEIRLHLPGADCLSVVEVKGQAEEMWEQKRRQYRVVGINRPTKKGKKTIS